MSGAGSTGSDSQLCSYSPPAAGKAGPRKVQHQGLSAGDTSLQPPGNLRHEGAAIQGQPQGKPHPDTGGAGEWCPLALGWFLQRTSPLQGLGATVGTICSSWAGDCPQSPTPPAGLCPWPRHVWPRWEPLHPPRGEGQALGRHTRVDGQWDSEVCPASSHGKSCPSPWGHTGGVALSHTQCSPCHLSPSLRAAAWDLAPTT